MCIRVFRSLLLAAGMLFLSTASFAQVGVSITIAPPELRAYEQPICPADGYIWTPGYWAYANDDYYWSPGLWVMAPEVGFLWTPGYWGWRDNGYFFNEGYWGTSVGFYGGINYGFGYFGRGYEGGRWEGGHFFYNTSLNRVSGAGFHNVYNTRVNVSSSSRVSYNGGRGGTSARATAGEQAAGQGRHVGPVAAQNEHVSAARNDPNQRSSASHGAATVGGTARSNTAVHPRDLPAIEHPAAPNTGNAKRDQTYQKQQNKLVTTQTQDRAKLQQRQEQEHQQLTRQNASQAKTQQVEQRHQQQTQQLQQKHTQQTQHMQQKAGGGGGGSHGGGRK